MEWIRWMVADELFVFGKFTGVNHETLTLRKGILKLFLKGCAENEKCFDHWGGP